MHAIHLPRAIRQEVLRLAEASATEEICGLISGNANGFKRIYPIANVAQDRQHLFELDPKGQIEAMRDIRQRGERLRAIYHSHPQGPVQPSATDIARHEYADALYLIAGPQAGSYVLRGFFISNGTAEEVALVE